MAATIVQINSSPDQAGDMIKSKCAVHIVHIIRGPASYIHSDWRYDRIHHNVAGQLHCIWKMYCVFAQFVQILHLPIIRSVRLVIWRSKPQDMQCRVSGQMHCGTIVQRPLDNLKILIPEIRIDQIRVQKHEVALKLSCHICKCISDIVYCKAD